MSLKDKFNNPLLTTSQRAGEEVSLRGKKQLGKWKLNQFHVPADSSDSPRPAILVKENRSKTKTDSCRTCYDSSVYSGSEGNLFQQRSKYI